MDDKTIGILLKSNPQKGIQAMMEEYHGLVNTITNRILYFSPLDAEECVADTFIQVWKNAEKVDFDRGTLKGYLIYTARNLSINRYKKIKRTATIELFENELSEEDDILDSLINRESVESIRQIIMGMPEPKKEIITRRYFLFETVKEIAQKLNLSSKQVENHLYQSKLFIRRQFEERM